MKVNELQEEEGKAEGEQSGDGSPTSPEALVIPGNSSPVPWQGPKRSCTRHGRFRSFPRSWFIIFVEIPNSLYTSSLHSSLVLISFNPCVSHTAESVLYRISLLYLLPKSEAQKLLFVTVIKRSILECLLT